MQSAKYPKGKHDYGLIIVFLSMAIGSVYYTDNYLNLSLTITLLIVFYWGIRYKRLRNFDHDKYNYKSRHPVFKLINQYGFDKCYKSLTKTCDETKGFVYKDDKLYASNYKIFNYYVTLSIQLC